MTNQMLFELMSEIDCDLIERAEAPVPMRKKPIFRVALIAAVLSLMLAVCTLTLGVAGTVAVIQYEGYVEENYPEYDGTVLHLTEIMLTEDQNLLSSLLDEDIRQALGSAIAALRQSWGEDRDSDRENTAEPDRETGDPGDDSAVGGERDPEQTTKPETETEQPTTEETTYQPPEDQAIFVHSSYDSLYMVAGEREIEVFSENYNQWRKKVEVTDPAVTHLKFNGWLAFALTTPGTYGYKIDQGEPVYDRSFSKVPEDMVKTVATYMGGKSCSRMAVLVPVADLAPGEHKVYICVKAANGNESNLVIFTVIIPDGWGEESETEPQISDELPEQGWSEGLAYTEQTRRGETVYVVSGIGECTDAQLYIPPTYQGYPVVGIEDEAFESNDFITLVALPSTVTHVGSKAFRYCDNLSTVLLTEGLEEIGSFAFANNFSLKQITLPDGLLVLEKGAFSASALALAELPDSLVTIERQTFESCSHLTQVKLPAGLQSIGVNAFSGCSSLEELDLPDALTEIQDGAFRQCKKLRTLTLPQSMQALGSDAFEFCNSLQTVYYLGTAKQWNAVEMTEFTREAMAALVVFANE